MKITLQLGVTTTWGSVLKITALGRLRTTDHRTRPRTPLSCTCWPLCRHLWECGERSLWRDFILQLLKILSGGKTPCFVPVLMLRQNCRISVKAPRKVCIWHRLWALSNQGWFPWELSFREWEEGEVWQERGAMPSLPATVQWRRVQSVSLITMPFYSFQVFTSKMQRDGPLNLEI